MLSQGCLAALQTPTNSPQRRAPEHFCVFRFCCAWQAGFSGVLAVVVQGTFIAAFCWPLIANREAMENVWHTLEWMWNTVLPCPLLPAYQAALSYFRRMQ